MGIRRQAREGKAEHVTLLRAQPRFEGELDLGMMERRQNRSDELEQRAERIASRFHGSSARGRGKRTSRDRPLIAHLQTGQIELAVLEVFEIVRIARDPRGEFVDATVASVIERYRRGRPSFSPPTGGE
jgi:hypothetical protein